MHLHVIKLNFRLKLQFYILSLIIISLSIAGCKEQQDPIKVIFDTDFGGDADDLGALAMLNHFKNNNEIDLLAVMAWNLEKYSVSAIDAVNTHYGNPDIPIGRREGEMHETDWNHSKVIADNLPHTSTYENSPDATKLYRRILSENKDNSVVIITVGPLMNIKVLLDSQPDDISPLNGKDLIHSKIKEFVIMGGNFPESKNEWNFDGDMPGVTKYVLDNLETPITFLGAEIGNVIRTGEVFNDLPKTSPLYLGFYHFSKHAPWMNHQFKGKIFDNATFDQTAILYVARNGVGTYWDRIENGFCQADSTGGDTWIPKDNSNHSYLVLKKLIPEMEALLESFMLGEF